MSVAFVTRDFTGEFPDLVPGGCCYYRCYLPAFTLKERTAVGLPEFDPIRGFGVKESKSTGLFGFSTVVLKLLMDRWTPRQMELAQALGQRIVVDIDDYYEGLTPANAAYAITNPENNKTTNREHYEKVIERADLLTVSTPFLLEHYSKKHTNVKMVRNGVNLQQFKPRKQRDRKPVIGWVGAVNFRNNDLEQLSEWLPDFLDKHDLMFHHAGHADNAPLFEDVTGVNPNRVTRSPLLPINHYAEGFQFDIGIVPLSDIPFNHAKSNIKGLEYVAAGIPFVSSYAPEYMELAATGVGRVAWDATGWVNWMTELLDYNNRKTQARSNLAIVKEHWAIDSRIHDWQTALNTI